MFSLKSLLLGVALAAIGSAALIYRTQVWTGALIALTLCLLAFAICRAMFVPKARAFWGSFAVFGAMYLAIVSHHSLTALNYGLPTTQLITYALEKLQTPMLTRGPIGSTTYVTPSFPPLPGPPDDSYRPQYGPVNSGSGKLVVTGTREEKYTRDTLFDFAIGTSADGFAAEARSFFWAAQCLFCLLLALAAGLTCSWLFRPVSQPGENAAAVHA